MWKLSLGPQPLIEPAAARAVPVAAGVVGVVLDPAAVADREVAAQPAGTAGEDVGNRLALFVIETEAAHVIAEDVRDGQRPVAAGHVTSSASGPSGSRAGS